MNTKSVLLVFSLFSSGTVFANFNGTVIDVLDGGRVVVSANDRLVVVKLNSLITPFPNQNLYPQSRQVFENVMLNKNVTVITKNEMDDRCVYGELFDRNANLNLALLMTGFAWIFNENEATQDYFQVEEYNKINQVGLWKPENHFKFNDITLTPEMMVNDCITHGLGGIPIKDQPQLEREDSKWGYFSAFKTVMWSVLFGCFIWFGVHLINERGYKYFRKPFSGIKLGKKEDKLK
jgi:hypothetical protein